MRVRVTAVVLSLVAAACSSSRGETGQTLPVVAVAVADPAAVALASAVDVRAVGCQAEAVRGAGAMVEGGFIVTAGHVVAGALSVSVQPASPADAPTVAARVVAIDPVNDLALLSAPDVELPELKLGTLTEGGQGVAIIFRTKEVIAQPFTVTRPVIVHIFDIYNHEKVDRRGFQVEIEVLPGDSGTILVGTDGTAGAALYAKSRGAKDRAWAVGMEAVPTLVAHASGAEWPSEPVGECTH